MLEAAAAFDLHDIAYNSFVRQYDRKTQFSASDMVYCITSILESPQKFLKPVPETSKEPEGRPTDPEESKEFVSTNNEEILKENFWGAYDALCQSRVELIKHGIRLAIEIQTAIVNQGTSLIEKKTVFPTSELRCAVIDNDNLQEVKFFQSPLALQKLALFIVDAFNQSNKEAGDKPLVLCVLNSKTNIFLVVGVTGSQGIAEINRK